MLTRAAGWRRISSVLHVRDETEKGGVNWPVWPNWRKDLNRILLVDASKSIVHLWREPANSAISTSRHDVRDGAVVQAGEAKGIASELECACDRPGGQSKRSMQAGGSGGENEDLGGEKCEVLDASL
jgi:hypothetical protein